MCKIQEFQKIHEFTDYRGNGAAGAVSTIKPAEA